MENKKEFEKIAKIVETLKQSPMTFEEHNVIHKISYYLNKLKLDITSKE